MTVFDENILDGRKNDFKKRERGTSEWFEPGDADTQDTPFDFLSVMLYPPPASNLNTISRNGKHTLEYNSPLIESWPMSPEDLEPLTVIDRVEIALAYQCNITQQLLVQYIHFNRFSSWQKISELRLEVQQSDQTSFQNQMKDLKQTFSDAIKGNICMWR